MEVDIQHRPSYAMATIKLAAGETIEAEAGSMVGMSDGVEIKTETKGGLMKGLKRMIGGESFFINTFAAPNGGEVLVAPSLPGDIVHKRVEGVMMLQSGSYIASSTGITVDSKWGGAKTFFGGEGLFLLRAEGSGDLVISSYGAIEEMELAAGQKFTIDTGHVVAFDEGMNFEVRKVGGWKSTFFSGEGLVVEITGPGKLLLQTRSPEAFLSWLIPQLPKPSSS